MKTTQKEDELIFCRCEEVSKADIEEAIKNGARTLDDIKRMTRAGMGLCQGKICFKIIISYLEQQLGHKITEDCLSTSRPPVRPVAIDAFAKAEIEEDK
jgi:NAD(P)H-nitrite reductase large subunit